MTDDQMTSPSCPFLPLYLSTSLPFYFVSLQGEKFLDTGDVLTTQCMNIQEVGALGLAAELAKGACPIMETLILKDCKVTTQGLCRIFQGIKISNLSTISTLNLRCATSPIRHYIPPIYTYISIPPIYTYIPLCLSITPLGITSSGQTVYPI